MQTSAALAGPVRVIASCLMHCHHHEQIIHLGPQALMASTLLKEISLSPSLLQRPSWMQSPHDMQSPITICTMAAPRH